MHESLLGFTNIFPRFHSNIPINKIINISLFQFLYILGQFSILFMRFISKGTFMVIVTFFEIIFISTIIIFISSCTNRCFVNKTFRKTVTIHRTAYFSKAIASLVVDAAGFFIILELCVRMTLFILGIQLNLILFLLNSLQCLW